MSGSAQWLTASRDTSPRAKAKGRLWGKQPKLNRRQEAHLVSLVHSGEYSTLEVAELFGVGRSTVYRAIERQRVEARAGLAGGRPVADTTSRRRCPVPATPMGCRRRDASEGVSAPSGFRLRDWAGNGVSGDVGEKRWAISRRPAVGQGRANLGTRTMAIPLGYGQRYAPQHLPMASSCS